MDAPEQSLLAVFESCDDYYQGSLSAAGLHELCKKLKLQQCYPRLVEYLFEDTKSERIFFKDFKEGLLKLLEADDKTDGELSLGREKKKAHTHGEKKHGRKFGLEDKNEIDEFSSDDLSQGGQSRNVSCSTNDSSSEESACKKRKTRRRRKQLNATTDNSGTSESTVDSQETSPVTNTMNEVEHLVTAWSNISQGDSLSRDELVRVFQCVGLGRDSNEAAKCVFDKLGFEEQGRITLQELLEFIKTGGSLNKEVKSQQMELESSQKNVSMEFIEHPSVGCVTGAYLLERWEREGVPGAVQLLQNLGFSTSQQIDISSLVSLLTDEIKGLTEEVKTSKRGLDPHLALLRANSVLQSLYVQSLKTTIEHLNAEKEKLRNDVVEANQRALFLAQEVDDHHSKLEHSTQQQVKGLEQKHAERIRLLTNQAKSEQDALLAQNMVLEKKLKSLEDEEIKNKAIISQLEMEARLSEQEHRTVVDQLTALQRTKEKLEKDLENVSFLQQKVADMEATLNETDVISLLERIQMLEAENTHLRDRNDELSVEVEELSTKLSNSAIKKRLNSSNPIALDQAADESIGGGAVKRRGDAFSLMDSTEDSGGEEESPRLGKVRKCSHSRDFTEATTSFKDLQIDGCSSGDCGGSCDSETAFADAKDVKQCKSEHSFQIIPFSKELEQVNGMSISTPSFQEDWCDDIKDKMKKLYEKLKTHDTVLANEVLSTLKEIVTEKSAKKDADSNESLRNRCKELEASLELLKEEYEKTEDYWAEKLEEERGFFEEEQRISDKKYSELLEKILEYEETYNVERERRQRLETIEEKDSFEKQVADMEQECAELKCKLNEVLKEKEVETEKLKSEIERLQFSRESVEYGVQTTDSELFDSDFRDQRDKWSGRSSTHRNELNGDSSGCKQCGDLKDLLQSKTNIQVELDHLKQERDKLFGLVAEQKQKVNHYECGRVSELEQKCHSLMVTLKQQQKQTEDILKNTWRQHKAEVKDLKSVLRMTEEKLKLQTKVIQEQLGKLAKTDLLVKDLFVENAYLISSVQKLDNQFQSTASSSKSGR